MNIHHLELFYFIVTHGGITEAARRMLQVPLVLLVPENHSAKSARVILKHTASVRCLLSWSIGVQCKLPGEETPSKIAVGTPVATLRVPDAGPPPVAPTNRPVPPWIVNSPTIANTGGAKGTNANHRGRDARARRTLP